MYDCIVVMGTWLRVFIILPGTNQVITSNIQIFSYTDPDSYISDISVSGGSEM